MPTAPRARCAISSCGEYATKRGRCDQHQRPAWHGSTHDQSISKADQARFRRKVLQREPNCRRCGAAATEADHIMPLAEGGAATDLANGQALCEACHAAKTKLDAARGVARGLARRRNHAENPTC